MSLSEDEDNFLSADEGQIDDEDDAKAAPSSSYPSQKDLTPKLSVQKASGEGCTTLSQSCNNNKKVIEEKLMAKQLEDEGLDKKEPSSSSLSVETDFSEESKQDDKSATAQSDDKQRDYDDEEEAIAERIRERNLKIARKFSAELAKTLKASAPIPVKTSAPIGIPKLCDTDSETSTPDSRSKNSLPPAPPPTPALSSSYNSEEPNAWTSTGSQYSWRIPPKSATIAPQPKLTPADEKSEQARLALDRLSENLSSPTDMNLLGKVFEDLKKVSIGGPETKSEGRESSLAGSAIPLIADLGSSLGGWGGWGASKLLASASQVTSQVGSVIDSVLQLPNDIEQSFKIPPPSSNNKQTVADQEQPQQKQETEQEITYPSKREESNYSGMESTGSSGTSLKNRRRRIEHDYSD